MIGRSAKSHRFYYYTCNRSYKQGSDACNAKSLPKDKLEKLVIEQIRNRILPDDVLTEERKGDIASQIKNSAEEHNADLVVIGHPESDAGFLERHLLMKEGTESFVKRLKEKIGCGVMIV